VGIPEPSTTTDGDGNYLFRSLKPATYRVAELVEDGWTATGPVSLEAVVSLDEDTKADFFDFAGGNITGIVWNDFNADGIRDTDPDTGELIEPGLPGWTVFLDFNNDRLLDPTEPSTTTDANGSYLFTNLPADDYEVTEVVPPGWDISPHYDSRQTAAVTALQTTSLATSRISTPAMVRSAA